MESILAWLTDLPPAALYTILALVAATENFIPPIPADVIVAFGSFLAARQNHSPVPTIIAVIAGNVGGAIVMFMLGRRFGADWIRRRLRGMMGDGMEQRVQHLYSRFGLPALFLSRFLPGVRAVVPPLAGAMRVPATGAILAIGTASAIWYTVIALLSYGVGSEWEQIVSAIGRFQRLAAIISAVLVAAVAAAWWLIRRRRQRRGA